MPKTAIRYVCAECGTEHSKWAGRCTSCGAWNTLEEQAVATKPVRPGQQRPSAEALAPTPISQVTREELTRLSTGSSEFDRVLGGGIVPGGLMLLGGEPGIGKSTLLLQISGAIAKAGSVLYVSGEESAAQIGLRARRLGIAGESLRILPATDADAVIQTIVSETPDLVIIDSVQTLSTDYYSSGAGSVTQVREVASRLGTVAKNSQVPIILVGHVTKDGQVAGPKVLEHLVDCVLYLEGEKFHGHRLLRGAKNRFGATDEVGVFLMEEDGLVDVPNPAGAFLDEETAHAAGTSVTVTLEGTRCLLVEVQALTVDTSFGYPKRTAAGFDLNKLHLLLAVLTRQTQLKLSAADVYLGVSGGYRLSEPANDLAVAVAIASAARNKPVAGKTVFIGECGLAGEVRPVTALGKRLEEAARAGFTRAIVPKQRASAVPGLKVVPVRRLSDAIEAAFGKAAS